MLTVNHTTSSFGLTTERVFSVQKVSYHTDDNESNRVNCSLASPFIGVILVMPDDSEELYAASIKEEVGSFDRFYVMNEQGKTIASYTL